MSASLFADEEGSRSGAWRSAARRFWSRSGDVLEILVSDENLGGPDHGRGSVFLGGKLQVYPGQVGGYRQSSRAVDAYHEGMHTRNGAPTTLKVLYMAHVSS